MLQLSLRCPVKVALKSLKYLLIFVTSLIVLVGFFTYASTWNRIKVISSSHFSSRVGVATIDYSALRREMGEKASILPSDRLREGHNGQITSKTYYSYIVIATYSR